MAGLGYSSATALAPAALCVSSLSYSGVAARAQRGVVPKPKATTRSTDRWRPSSRLPVLHRPHGQKPSASSSRARRPRMRAGVRGGGEVGKTRSWRRCSPSAVRCRNLTTAQVSALAEASSRARRRRATRWWRRTPARGADGRTLGVLAADDAGFDARVGGDVPVAHGGDRSAARRVPEADEAERVRRRGVGAEGSVRGDGGLRRRRRRRHRRREEAVPRAAAARLPGGAPPRRGDVEPREGDQRAARARHQFSSTWARKTPSSRSAPPSSTAACRRTPGAQPDGYFGSLYPDYIPLMEAAVGPTRRWRRRSTRGKEENCRSGGVARHEKAQLMGYETHADFCRGAMSKSAAKVKPSPTRREAAAAPRVRRSARLSRRSTSPTPRRRRRCTIGRTTRSS